MLTDPGCPFITRRDIGPLGFGQLYQANLRLGLFLILLRILLRILTLIQVNFSVVLPNRQIVSETLDHIKDPGLSISDLPQNDE